MTRSKVAYNQVKVERVQHVARYARTRIAFEQTQQRRYHAILQEGRLGVLALEVVVLENIVDRLAQLGADKREL